MRRLVILLVICVLLFSTISAFGEEIRIKWASMEAMGGIQCQIMEWVTSEIERRSDGRLIVDFYPANQLGSTNETIDGLIAGTVDIYPLAGNCMGTLGKDWIVDALPFVFRTMQHRIRYNNSELNKARKEDLLKKHGLRIICTNWFYNPHILVSKKPILLPEDFDGFKMRVPEARGQYIGWKELGATPATIQWGEVYLGLRQGVVDGVSVPLELIVEQHFDEVLSNVSMLETEWGYENILVNEKFYQSLPEDLRDILVEVTKEGGDRYTKLANQAFDEAYRTLVEEGVKIYYVDNNIFREKLKGLPEKLDKEGLLDKEMFEKIQNL